MGWPTGLTTTTGHELLLVYALALNAKEVILALLQIIQGRSRNADGYGFEREATSNLPTGT